MLWLSRLRPPVPGTASKPRASTREILGLLTLVFLGVPLLAQDPGMPKPPEATWSPGRAALLSVEGRVVYRMDGANLSGVLVSLTDFRGVLRGTYYTREGGAFAFTNLGPGRYTLTFSLQGFIEENQTLELIFSSSRGLVVALFPTEKTASSSAIPLAPVWALQVPAKAQKEFEKGLAWLERDGSKQSLSHLQEAIRLYPQYAAAYAALATAQTNLSDSAAARESYERALEIDPNLFAACLGLGTLHIQEKRYREAEKYLLRARMLRPDDWRVIYQFGEMYWGLGDWPRTEETVRRGIALHEKLPRLHILLINSLAGQEKLPDALVTMEDFLRLFPRHPAASQVRLKRDQLKAEIEKNGAAAVKP